MNNLAEVCFVKLLVKRNHGRCLFISMGLLGGANRCGRGFKVVILREGAREGANHKEWTSF